jgi:hypothetical protein
MVHKCTAELVRDTLDSIPDGEFTLPDLTVKMRVRFRDYPTKNELSMYLRHIPTVRRVEGRWIKVGP